MSKRRDSEIMFGSDSFLDVVANIVGILIILIVIAGVRVGQAPVSSRSSVAPSIPDSVPVDDLAPPAAPSESESTEIAPIMADVSEDAKPASLNDPLPLPDVAPPPELVKRAEDLEQEIELITSNCRSLNEALTHNNRLHSELQQRLEAAKNLSGWNCDKRP